MNLYLKNGLIYNMTPFHLILSLKDETSNERLFFTKQIFFVNFTLDF